MKYLPALIVTTCLYFIVPIDAQRSCCTHCKDQQLGLSAPQAKRLQGPRGKQGPIGHPGVQGEKVHVQFILVEVLSTPNVKYLLWL